MDQVEGAGSLSSELTVEQLLRGVLTLEQGQAKKVFKLLQRGLENLVAQKLIPTSVAKEFRQMRAKTLKGEKKMDTRGVNISIRSWEESFTVEAGREDFLAALREEWEKNKELLRKGTTSLNALKVNALRKFFPDVDEFHLSWASVDFPVPEPEVMPDGRLLYRRPNNAAVITALERGIGGLIIEAVGIDEFETVFRSNRQAELMREQVFPMFVQEILSRPEFCKKDGKIFGPAGKDVGTASRTCLQLDLSRQVEWHIDSYVSNGSLSLRAWGEGIRGCGIYVNVLGVDFFVLKRYICAPVIVSSNTEKRCASVREVVDYLLDKDARAM